MTTKQRKCINWICRVLDMHYTGTTDKDAWSFINKYKPMADKAMKTFTTNDTNETFLNPADADCPEMTASMESGLPVIKKKTHRNYLSCVAPDMMVLDMIAALDIPARSVTLATRENSNWEKDYDNFNLDEDEIDELCPGGIQCKDDMDEYGWIYAMRDNPCL